jgi:predicted amidohydrolase
MATTGYVWPNTDSIRPHAEPADGPTAAHFGPLAQEFGSRIVLGFVEECKGLLYNAALTLGPDGEIESVYRKILLYELDESWATPGSERSVIHADRMTLVPGICMDLNDEGFVHFVREQRPDIIPFCTNWLEQGIDVTAYWAWRLSDWRGWFVAANSWGPDTDIEFCGRSAILAPGGIPVRRAPSQGDCVLTFDTRLCPP